MNKTKVLLFSAAALIAILSGALAGALTLPRSSPASDEVGVDRSLETTPAPSLEPSPTGTVDVSGPCDEPEHATDPACVDLGDPDDDDDDDDDEGGDGGDNSGPGGGGSSGPG